MQSTGSAVVDGHWLSAARLRSVAECPVLRRLRGEQVRVGGLGDTGVALQVGGVAVTVQGEEDARVELLGEALRPLVRRGGGAGGGAGGDGAWGPGVGGPRPRRW